MAGRQKYDHFGQGGEAPPRLPYRQQSSGIESGVRRKQVARREKIPLNEFKFPKYCTCCGKPRDIKKEYPNFVDKDTGQFIEQHRESLQKLTRSRMHAGCKESGGVRYCINCGDKIDLDASLELAKAKHDKNNPKLMFNTRESLVAIRRCVKCVS